MNNKLFNQFLSKGIPTTEMGQWVFQEKVKMLYRNHTQSWILSILAASLITYLAIESGFIVVGISWWAAFVVVSLLRTWNTVKFCRVSDRQQITDYCPWFRWFYFYTFLAGMGWCVVYKITHLHIYFVFMCLQYMFYIYLVYYSYMHLICIF